jgi:hypothetical protein
LRCEPPAVSPEEIWREAAIIKNCSTPDSDFAPALECRDVPTPARAYGYRRNHRHAPLHMIEENMANGQEFAMYLLCGLTVVKNHTDANARTQNQ